MGILLKKKINLNTLPFNIWPSFTDKCTSIVEVNYSVKVLAFTNLNSTILIDSILGYRSILTSYKLSTHNSRKAHLHNGAI